MIRVAFPEGATLAALQAVREAYGDAWIALLPHGEAITGAATISRYDCTSAAEAAAEARAYADGTIKEASMDRRHEFLWIDFETTGLDPRDGLPLEFAIVLCEDDAAGDFAVVQQFAGAIHYTPEVLALAPIDDVVRRMHERNGLWEACRTSSITLDTVRSFLEQFAAQLTHGRKGAITLAGSSVHFDLAWARVHFPAFAEYCSHRVFDVSTLRRAVAAWKPGVAWPTRDAHRALDDVLATIAECRVARAAMFGAGA